MSRYLLYAIRKALRAPRPFLLQALSLAVGLGFATTVFIFGDALFLAPLPVTGPDRLFSIFGQQEKHSDLLPISFPNFEDLQGNDGPFSEVAAYQWARTILRDLDRPERFAGQLVTANYFRVLGVGLAAGRGFSADDENVAIISLALARRLGAEPAAVLGTSITLDDHPYTVIGVAPTGFNGIGAMGVVAEYWLPMTVFERVSAFGKYKDERSALLFVGIGRLRDGVTPAAAFDELGAVARRLRGEFPKDNASLEFAARPLGESLIDPSLRDGAMLGAWIATGLSVLLLLVVGLNVWNLLWVRASDEGAEVALRRALGAGRSELVRQLVAESILVAGVATVAGILAARTLASWVWSLRPSTFSEGYLAVEVNWRVVIFSFAVSSLVMLFASSVFLLRSSRGDLSVLMKAGGRGAGPNSLSLGLRYVLVTLQVAMALLAAAVAGMFVHSLQHSLTLDIGLDSQRLLLAEYDLKGEGLAADEIHRLGRRFIEEVSAWPAVESASLATFPPLAPLTPMWSLTLEGSDLGGPRPFVHFNPVETGYFRTSGLSILQGREFNANESAATLRVAIINRTMAERYWPGGDALDQRLRLGQEQTEYVVVGIAENSKYGSLGEDPLPYVYVPRVQATQTRGTLLVRSRRDPRSLVKGVRDTMQKLAPRVPINRVEALEDRLHSALWPTRMAILASFTVGLICWLLAVLGVFGIVETVVRGRRREIAIRSALGARPRQFLPQIFRATFLSLAVGLVVGIAAATTASQLFRRVLFGFSSLDLPVILGTAVLLSLVCGLATWIPARRAVLTPPATVLRDE